jgi:hypothetical protein
MSDIQKLIDDNLAKEDYELIKKLCNQGDFPRMNPGSVALIVAKVFQNKKANEASKPDAAALRIESVSGCNLPTDDTIEKLFENGATAPFYSDITEEIGHAGYHFINGMKAMRNILKAANTL